MTAWSGRASPSTWGPSGETPRRSLRRRRRRAVGGRQGRGVRARCGGRLESGARGRRDRALRRDARSPPPSCGAPQRPHPRHGACLRTRDRGGARRASRARGRGCGGSRRACVSTSSWTREWAGGASRSSRRRTRRRRGDEPFRVRRVDPAFTALQIDRFREATARLRSLTRHIANSAATLRYAEARFDAVRCGIAVYGISPFGTDPAPKASSRRCAGIVPRAREAARPGREHGLRAAVRRRRPTWIGIVPVGYADGFRRDMTGTEVLVDGARRPRRGDDLHGCAGRRARRRARRSERR